MEHKDLCMQLLSVLTNEVIILKDYKLFEDRDNLFHLCTPIFFYQKSFADGDII